MVGKTKEAIPSLSSLVNAFTEKDDVPLVPSAISKFIPSKSSLKPFGSISSGKSLPSKKHIIKKVKKGKKAVITKKLVKPFVKKLKKLFAKGFKIWKKVSSGSQKSSDNSNKFKSH